MKLILVILSSLLALAFAVEPIQLYYHENVGIRKAELIKQAELAADFDGSRIIGGSPSPLGAFPFMGGLIVSLTNGMTSMCGSTLVSVSRAVTAAHCWRDGRSQGRELTIVLGSTRLFTGGTRIITSDVELHANYVTTMLHNDIGIIRFNPVVLNNIIRPIGLVSGPNNLVGVRAVAIGFGETKHSESITANQYLSHVNLQVITNDVCWQTFGLVVTDTTLCTSGAGNVGICSGDSGGPLIANNVLIGVSSFASIRNCELGLPSGFARVSSFESWIRSRM